MNFLNKVVLITGATGGIGKATAKAFADEGAKLVLVSRRMEVLKDIARELNLKEGNYLLISADVSKEEEVQKYVQMTKDTFGRIDVFFNNAGSVGAVELFADYPSEALESIINLNLKGTFWGLQYVLRVMLEQQSGSVVNMSSVGGLIGGLSHTSGYIATKHAIVGITKSAAAEYAKNGIRINAVCPAQINTDMMRTIESGINPEDSKSAQEILASDIPMGRYGDPSEVANAVLFLASEKASFITGVALPIDGGLLA